MPTLKELLIVKSNNYSKLSRLFRKKTGVDIVNGYKKDIPLTKSCSVIIPFYRNYLTFKKNLIALQKQDIPLASKKNKIEVIIIDDGSLIDIKKLKKTIQQTQKLYRIVFLQLRKNYGRATARNLGLLFAQNEIIIFLDSDVIIHNHFIRSHLLRHEFLRKCIVVGLHHKIGVYDPILRLESLKKDIVEIPDYKSDFRYKKFVPLEWRNTYREIPFRNFNKVYYLLKESDYFKDFGEGKILGVWSLAFMFLTGNVSVARKYILEVGGFDFKFKGWGMEDVHLGAKLIALGLYLIPNLHATAYHVVRKIRKEQKIEEYNRNLKLYNKLKHEKIVYFKENEWKEKMRSYFKNKFCRITF